MNELAPGIRTVRAFSPEEARDVIIAAESSTLWHRAFINADLEVNPAVRDAEVLFEQVHQPHAALYRMRLAIAAAPLVSAAAPGSTLIEVQLVRYRPGGHYADHRDAPLGGPVVRTLSLVCFLNDDFSGGDLVFPEHNLTVRPQAGILVAFPPAYLHRAEPVTCGTKFAITAWYHGRAAAER
jgi:predicted 2-oxoglutarate/Fe(II)-dependent dioxygenase YbiX